HPRGSSTCGFSVSIKVQVPQRGGEPSKGAIPLFDVPDNMQSPDSNSPTRFLLRCEVGSKMGLMVCTLQERKDTHITTITTGKRMSCFLMSGLRPAFLLVLCSASSVCSSHTSTETTATKAGAAKATVVVIADAYTSVVASVLGPPTFPFLGTDMKYHIV